MQRQVIAAAVQMAPQIGEKALNLQTSIERVQTAVREGAQLVVLPELCNTGYVFDSQQELLDGAEPVPGGPTTSAWEAMCREHGVYLVAGLAERDGDTCYNTAVVMGPDGYIGKYRKTHLWGRETLLFSPGSDGFPVFDTGIGRVGVMICYDCWFPESYRLCALAGADVICIPTNWVPEESFPGFPTAGALLCMTNAHVNGVSIVAADRVSAERGQDFAGQSIIVSHTGQPLAGPASPTEQEILLVTVAIDRTISWGEFNHPLTDRRPDKYGAVSSSPQLESPGRLPDLQQSGTLEAARTSGMKA